MTMPCSLAVGLVALQTVAAGAAVQHERLPPAQQEMFTRLASDEFCGCASALTLAGCLEKRPDCRLATYLERLLVRGIEFGAPEHALQGFMSEEVLGPFCAPPLTFHVEDAPRKGKAGAAITVVEFADFRCSHCRHAVPMVHKALQTYGNKVQLFYLPIALQDNEMSTAAAEAALAAHAQGKFWDMHAALFAKEDGEFPADVLRDIAKKVGLNLKQFDKDLATHRFRPALAAWKKMSIDAEVHGTPAFFINGRRFNLTPEIFTLEDRFEMEMVRDQSECK